MGLTGDRHTSQGQLQPPPQVSSLDRHPPVPCAATSTRASSHTLGLLPHLCSTPSCPTPYPPTHPPRLAATANTSMPPSRSTSPLGPSAHAPSTASFALRTAPSTSRSTPCATQSGRHSPRGRSHSCARARWAGPPLQRRPQGPPEAAAGRPGALADPFGLAPDRLAGQRRRGGRGRPQLAPLSLPILSPPRVAATLPAMTASQA